MRKLFAGLFVIMFLVSFVLAQNTSTVTTTGGNNIATVDQTGNNDASIEQITNNSDATQIQNGSGNVAEIDQKGGWPPGSTTDNESAYQYQEGSNNETTLWQLADAGTGGNVGNQFQLNAGNLLVAWQYTIGSEVDQDQIGNNNYSYQSQTGNGHISNVSQVGDNNISNVIQQQAYIQGASKGCLSQQ